MKVVAPAGTFSEVKLAVPLARVDWMKAHGGAAQVVEGALAVPLARVDWMKAVREVRQALNHNGLQYPWLGSIG